MKELFVLTILSAFSLSVHAKTLELKKNNSSIYITEKKDWELGKDLFGMPFIYFSPQLNGQRSNISFTDTGAEVELDVKALESSQTEYQKRKKIWASKVNAEIISFNPYHVKKNRRGHKVHMIGMSYKNEESLYLETSYYMECRGKIIFSKSLRLKINQDHQKDFDELINTLDCGGV